jgi:hypothetical protein
MEIFYYSKHVYYTLPMFSSNSNTTLMLKRGRDRMVVRFTIAYATSAYHHCCCEFESRSSRGVQHYVIKFIWKYSITVNMCIILYLCFLTASVA